MVTPQSHLVLSIRSRKLAAACSSLRRPLVALAGVVSTLEKHTPNVTSVDTFQWGNGGPLETDFISPECGVEPDGSRPTR